MLIDLLIPEDNETKKWMDKFDPLEWFYDDCKFDVTGQVSECPIISDD